MKTIKYYAVALNGGQISQLLVTRKNGRHFDQGFTGKTYQDMKEARADLVRLNCVAAK